jgi:peptidoglycan hydrolase-like protein with peptidoglycan-binding domain
MRFAPPRRRAHTSQRATGRLGAFSATSALGMVLAVAIPSAAAAVYPPASAGWHGHAIQNPKPQGDAVTTAASLPLGWSAGPVRLGTGFRNPDGSDRVREVQQRLWKLGYRPGPVDGLFGPRTQAAVEWFQIKHGIQPDGVVGLATLGLLRERTSAAPGVAVSREPVRDVRVGARGAAPQPQRATHSADRGQKPAGGRGGGFFTLPLLLLAVPAALALIALARVRRSDGGPRATPRKPKPPAADRGAAAAGMQSPKPTPTPAAKKAPTPAPAASQTPTPAPTSANSEPSTAIGYVRAAAGDRAELARHAGAIRRACTERGWKVTQLVCDDNQAGAHRALERPGLAAAMEHLAGAGPSRLVVSKLAHLSRSPADLTALFEWFERNDVQVIATDVGLDTTTAEGRRAAQSQLAAFAGRQVRARRNGHKGAGKNAKAERSSART